MTLSQRQTDIASWEQEWVDAFLQCPGCGGADLERESEAVRCGSCGHAVPLVDSGILTNLPLEAPAESADAVGARGFEALSARVRRFYEEHPFPNYDGFESVGDLLSRASRSVYAAMLDQQIPIGARVLEVGCGTGQLGAFLSIGGRAVVGVDMSRASLRLGQDFKLRHHLRDCNFLHASLFEIPLKAEAFDLLICKGVLHHTPDARAGFRAILRMLRPGGFVICGLYNRIGRIPTSVRRVWFRLFRGSPKSADMVLREMTKSDQKALSWYLDQYAHPLETRHTVDEVLAWFEENDIEFLQGVPPVRPLDRLDPAASLFAPAPRGNRLGRLLTQCKWIATIGREGALFDMIGRKRGGEAEACP